MAKSAQFKGLYRIFDANLNRVKEGLRVCEEVTRFVLDDRKLTSGLKRIRHRIDSISEGLRKDPRLIRQRDSREDVGLKVKSQSELNRKNLADIFCANIQRVKESVRVLEEFSKLHDLKAALGFRKIRYNIYELEKKVALKLPALRGPK